ncbi:MAG: glycosyltransferase [Thermoanaerobaculia bacterium]|nr:MAG: glycosyltransferase [Thermoanaerobaculia bacterium]
MRLRSLPGRVARTLERELRKLRRIDEQVVRLPAAVDPPRGRAIFSYVIDPFLRPPGAPVSHAHTHFWESLTMGRTLAELGFEVEVVHWTNRTFEPRGPRDLLVDVRLLLERLAPRLGPECLRVMHAETAHPSFYNPAQRARLDALAARRGIRLAPFKLLDDNRAIEHADAATILGNEATQATYRFAGKPLYPVPISQPLLYPFPERKDFAAARTRFLWFGSGGMVHKGLDLVLEAFAGLPGLELAVAGPVERERDFERAFARELYRTPNIRTLGWVDIASPAFTELAAGALGLVYPSCSEGQNGGTVTCMHAGLIPIVTPEVGVDVPPVAGVVLREATVEGIRAAVAGLAGRPPAELEAMARSAWRHAREHHTRERFATVYRQRLLEILARFRPALRERLPA